MGGPKEQAVESVTCLYRKHRQESMQCHSAAMYVAAWSQSKDGRTCSVNANGK